MSDVAPIGYQLQEVIGTGTTGIVHRATDPANEQVALKIARDYDLTMMTRVRREIALLQRIHHPGIIGLRDSGVVDGLPWYAMDLLPRQTLADTFREHLPTLREATTLLCQLASVLQIIHARGYVHGDLKPENIFLRADGSPIIGDLNLVREATRGANAGTPLYSAPEQIRGEPLDARTDLYALGCLAHRLISGEPPFADPTTLLGDHLLEPPPRLAIPDTLADLVDGLLAKRRQDRPGYARDLLPVLSPWCDSRDSNCGPVAPPHLYSPTLQGRKELLQQFRRFAPFGARGAGILIAGESGVGKTAVAERLTELLHDQGWQVVHAAAPGATHPLAPLRPLLQTLVDASWVGGAALAQRLFGKHGGALSLYHEAISELPGIEARPANTLSTQTGRTELFRDLERALRGFAQERRLALIIDDLHLADELTVGFLERAMRPELHRAGILIVGLYRPEAAQNLRNLLDGDPEPLVLQPLSDADVTRMIADMLASSDAPQPLASALVREAQGNPFYVTEYLRMAVDRGLLVRTARGWSATVQDAQLPIPASIQALMRERLTELSSDARELITTAALIGGDFPPELLTTASGLATEDAAPTMETLLRNRMLMQTRDDALRFRHEQLRLLVLDETSPRPARNRSIALALERHYFGRADYPDLFQTIAEHWLHARDPATASTFYQRAGAYALKRAAYQAAERYYQAALANAGEIDHSERAALLFRLALAQHSVGNLAPAAASMLEALAGFGVNIPASRAGWTVALLRELALRFLTPLRAAARDDESVDELVRATAFMAECYFMENHLLGMYAMALTSVNAGSRSSRTDNARPYAYLGFAAGTVGLTRTAQRLLARSRQIAHDQQEPADIAYVWLATSVYEGGRGRWHEARAAVLTGLDELDTDLVPYGYEELQSCLTNIDFYQGEFTNSLDRAADLKRYAEQRDHGPDQAWCWVYIARIELLRGDFRSAQTHIEQARVLCGDARDGFLELMIPGLGALTSLHLGDRTAAAAAAELSLSRLSGAMATNFATREAYLATASVFRALGNAHGERQTVAELTRFAWLFPMARPVASLYRSTLNHRSPGRTRQRKLLKAASRHGAAYDEILLRQARKVDQEEPLAKLCAKLGLPTAPVF